MTELVVLRAADDAALVAEISRLVGFLDRVPDVPLVDVAYTCSLTSGPNALSIIADGVPSLRSRLVSAKSRIVSGASRRIRDKSGTYYFRDHLLGPGLGKLAFVYPGVACVCLPRGDVVLSRHDARARDRAARMPLGVRRA